MELVKLKMKMSYKLTLVIIFLFILCTGVLGTLYLANKNNIQNNSDIEVKDNLSINYLDGKNILVDDTTTYKFSVTNNSDNNINCFIKFSKVRGSGNYKIVSDSVTILEGELIESDEINTDEIILSPKETKVFELVMVKSSEEPLKASLTIKEKENATVTFADIILKNNEVKNDSITKVGEEVAIENEGLIKSIDDLGTSYYFRGKADNNYVSFAGETWRIVRINGDNTVRLILNGITSSVSNYYTDYNADLNYESSNINTYLESWYNEKLSNYSDYVVNTKYCSDIGHDETHTYYAYTRVAVNKIPTLNCLGDSYSSNIGLLTVDELIYAGALLDKPNKDFYLYNGGIGEWYTMTAAKGSDSYVNMFMFNDSGNIVTSTNGNLYRNIRPVINLVKNVQVEGTGSVNDPYTIIIPE